MKKSQGEIFGIALFFVIIIIGIIIYSQIASFKTNETQLLITEKQYNILSKGTLNTLLSQSTGCYVGRGQDSISDLLKFCLEATYSGKDPYYDCNGGIYACNYSISLLNSSLNNLFNSSGIIGEIPYSLRISVPRNPSSLLNREDIQTTIFKGKSISLKEKDYLKYKFNKVSSGVYPIASAQGFVEIELSIYYR